MPAGAIRQAKKAATAGKRKEVHAGSVCEKTKAPILRQAQYRSEHADSVRFQRGRGEYRRSGKLEIPNCSMGCNGKLAALERIRFAQRFLRTDAANLTAMLGHL